MIQHHREGENLTMHGRTGGESTIVTTDASDALGQMIDVYRQAQVDGCAPYGTPTLSEIWDMRTALDNCADFHRGRWAMAYPDFLEEIQ